MEEILSMVIFAATLSLSSFGLKYLMGRKRVPLKKIIRRSMVMMPLILGWILFFSSLSGRMAFMMNLALMGYVFVMHLYAFLSFKQTLGDTIVYLLAIEPLLLTTLIPGLNIVVGCFLILLSSVSAVYALWRIYKLPFKNYEFFDETLKLCAKKCGEGAYSSKPVVVSLNLRNRFVSSSKGALLVVKNGRMVLRLSKKKHEELGSPNLMELARAFADELQGWLNHHEPKEVALQ